METQPLAPGVRELLDAKGFDPGLLHRIPRRHRDDALQEACLAALTGRNPTTAVLNYYRDQRKAERRRPGG